MGKSRNENYRPTTPHEFASTASPRSYSSWCHSKFLSFSILWQRIARSKFLVRFMNAYFAALFPRWLEKVGRGETEVCPFPCFISTGRLRPVRPNALPGGSSIFRCSRTIAEESDQCTRVKAATLQSMFPETVEYAILGVPIRYEDP